MNFALEQLLAAQDNVVTRQQAMQHMSLDAVRHRLGSRWQILLPGVYLGATGTPTDRQQLRAALLYGGPTSMLGDATALGGFRVRYLPEDRNVYLLLPAEIRRVNRDGVTVRRTHRPPTPRILNGLPYCPPGRALVEFAARIGDRRVATAVLADAVQRGIVWPEALALEVPHLTGRGAAMARLVVADIIGGVRSAPEADFATICSQSTILPPPMLNALLALPDDRRVSPDALWIEAGLVHETNGRAYHAAEDDFEDMQSRHDAMTAAGLTVLHDAPRQLLQDAGRILAQLETCYRRDAGRGLPPGVRLLRAGPPQRGHTHVPSMAS
jgi:hypothetical protein